MKIDREWVLVAGDAYKKACRHDYWFLADIAAAIAAAAPLIQAAERHRCMWQPIATAPVDGQILVWSDETNMAEVYDGDGETPVSDMLPSADHWMAIQRPAAIRARGDA